jgi:hypothetical protein
MHMFDVEHMQACLGAKPALEAVTLVTDRTQAFPLDSSNSDNHGRDLGSEPIGIWATAVPPGSGGIGVQGRGHLVHR